MAIMYEGFDWARLDCLSVRWKVPSEDKPNSTKIWISFKPGPGMSLNVDLSFDHPVVGVEEMANLKSYRFKWKKVLY